MKSEQFKSIITKIVEPELAILGYNVDRNPPSYDEPGDIWFEKIIHDSIFIVIDFQPSWLAPDHTVDFAVNLARNNPSYDVYRKRKGSPEYLLDERLAPWLWTQDRNDPKWKIDYWWHFLNETELENSCRDVLDKLQKFGIPFLENLASKSPKSWYSRPKS
mgnify:CR=1 FL=1